MKGRWYMKALPAMAIQSGTKAQSYTKFLTYAKAHPYTVRNICSTASASAASVTYPRIFVPKAMLSPPICVPDHPKRSKANGNPHTWCVVRRTGKYRVWFAFFTALHECSVYHTWSNLHIWLHFAYWSNLLWLMISDWNFMHDCTCIDEEASCMQALHKSWTNICLDVDTLIIYVCAFVSVWTFVRVCHVWLDDNHAELSFTFSPSLSLGLSIKRTVGLCWTKNTLA